jgi:hypothetical protein
VCTPSPLTGTWVVAVRAGSAQLFRRRGGAVDGAHDRTGPLDPDVAAIALLDYAWRGSGVVHAVVTALVLATSRVPANASGAGPLAPSATRAGCASGDLRDRRRLRCKTCIRRPVFVLPRVCGASTVVVTAFVRRRQPGRPNSWCRIVVAPSPGAVVVAVVARGYHDATTGKAR